MCLENVQAYKWKHPESPSQLVRRGLFCPNLLLAHLHCAGDTPDDLRSSKSGEYLLAEMCKLPAVVNTIF